MCRNTTDNHRRMRSEEVVINTCKAAIHPRTSKHQLHNHDRLILLSYFVLVPVRLS